MGAIVEDQDVAVGERSRVVLLRQRRRPEPPDDASGRPLDHHDGRDVAKADDDVALGRLAHGVAVRPLGAVVLRGDRKRLGFEVLPAAPFPHDPPRNRHLDQIIGVDHAIGFAAGQPAPNARGNLSG